MEGRTPPRHTGGFRHFFFRGLAIILPTVLTIWILIAAYQFVQSRIAAPINEGVRQVFLMVTPWPQVTDEQIQGARQEIERVGGEPLRALRQAQSEVERRAVLIHQARYSQLNDWWARWAIVMDLIGLVVAIILIYTVGVLLGSYIGRRLYVRGEMLINRVPLISRVYPSVKQVTDFFFGDNDQRVKFSRVVAVEYPRKGLWSVGLVTGDTMQFIQDRAGEHCMTVFVPSSPTPFTGYVITVPRRDTIDLPITVEDAIKFAVSGGVLIPPSQRIAPDAAADGALADAAPQAADGQAQILQGTRDREP